MSQAEKENKEREAQKAMVATQSDSNDTSSSDEDQDGKEVTNLCLMVKEDKRIGESQADAEIKADMATKSAYKVYSSKPISYD